MTPRDRSDNATSCRSHQDGQISAPLLFRPVEEALFSQRDDYLELFGPLMDVGLVFVWKSLRVDRRRLFGGGLPAEVMKNVTAFLQKPFELDAITKLFE